MRRGRTMAALAAACLLAPVAAAEANAQTTAPTSQKIFLWVAGLIAALYVLGRLAGKAPAKTAS
jgi:hypothetical protein